MMAEASKSEGNSGAKAVWVSPSLCFGDGRVILASTGRPAVLHFYRRFEPGATDEGVIRFLLTAAAIGMLLTLTP
jgi:hypothetical protein